MVDTHKFIVVSNKSIIRKYILLGGASAFLYKLKRALSNIGESIWH
jgi:hypothetical protein